jgi:acyl carrier protein
MMIADIYNVIIEMMAERLELDEPSLEKLRHNGRLDEFTAVDSLLTVELVLNLEERFGIRFDPENIDAELINNMDRLAAFVSEAQSAA